ncbi:MAG: phage capsid protein [Akkermansia sp.]|nr:phage capsid protein [Akkermansia sp.]
MAEITQNYQIKYSEKWGSYLQQEASRLEKYVTVESGLSGKMVAFDQYGLLSFNEKKERMQATALDEAPTTRRVLYPRIFSKAIGFDEFDAKKLANIDVPVSKTIEGLRAAAGRCMDNVMLDSFLGTCYVGENGTDPVDFDENQIIDTDFVESGTAVTTDLTIGKLRKALAMLQKAEAWNEERRAYGDELVLACSSSQIASLLKEPEVGSFDYNTARALAEGKIESFLGFRIIRTEQLPIDENGVRSCLAWVKSKAQFGLWEDFKVKLSVRDDLDEALQIRAKFACGATRLQEEAFVKILCKEI